jgi:hypothetical protein
VKVHVSVGVLFLSVVALSGCARLNVQWDEARIHDFAPYRTFTFAPDPGVAPGLTPDRADQSRSNRDLAKRELRSGLEGRGYAHAAANADFVIHYWLGNAAKDGLEPSGSQRQGELDVWFINPGDQQRFWGGWASMTLYQDIDGADEIREACGRLLEDVPVRN